MGQILAIVSSKGGVGKTTTAVNLAAAFASLDFPTLLVEADPQCGIVANFGFDRFDIPRGLAEVARREARADEVTFETSVEGLHLVSSNVWSQAEEADYLRALELDPLVFKEQLASVAAAYDYVVIDAPPMLGPITVAILAAAHRFIVPLQTEPQALRSLGRLVETAGQVRDRYNRGLIFDGIALTMVDSRTRLSQQVIDQVQADYPDLSFGNSIPRSVRLSEMAAAGRPLVVAAPASRGARAYAALAEEILLKHARERMMERAGEDDGPDGDDDTPGRPDGTPAGTSHRADSSAVVDSRPAVADLFADDDEPADGEQFEDEPADDGPADDGPSDDRPADDRPADDSAVDEEMAWRGTPADGERGQTAADVVAPAGEPSDDTPAGDAGPAAMSPATGVAEGIAAPGPADAAGAPADPAADLRLTGRIAIASGRIPERGGDIHKTRRKPRNGHVTLLPPGVSGGAQHGGTRGGAPRHALAQGAGVPFDPKPLDPKSFDPKSLDPKRGAAEATTGQSSFLDDEAPDEWNEENFVDLDTYMKMEAGETAGAGALASDEDEWDEEWGQ